MTLAFVGQAAVMFAVTNIDDLVVLAVFFGRAGSRRGGVARVIAGQYLGFVGILALSIAGALGASLLPEKVIPYLGLLPLALGLRAAWQAWRSRGDGEGPSGDGGAGVLEVAAVTFANGGDNIGVYLPVFAVVGVSGTIGYSVIFLIGIGLCCAAGWYVASRPAVAPLLTRWGHLILPVVLIAIGLGILIEGGAFGW